MDKAFTSSQTGLPNFGNRSQGFHGPISAPALSIAVKPLKFVSMPSRISLRRATHAQAAADFIAGAGDDRLRGLESAGNDLALGEDIAADLP